MPDSDALLMQKEEATKPALSATSDKPVFIQKDTKEDNPVESKEPVAKTEVTPVDSESAAAKAKTTEDSATSEEDHSGEDTAANAEAGAKPAKGVQKRIDELTRQRGDAERLASEQSKRLDKALELIERLSGADAGKARAEAREDDPRPNRQQFDDPDAYTEELSAWSSRQAVKAYKIEQQQATQQAKVAEEFGKVTKSWAEGQEKILEKYPDYVEVAQNPDLPIPQHVGFAIAHNTNGHEIAYWLGKNPKEAERIASLDPPMAVMEIGALGQKLLADKPGVSKAPAPVKPIGSRSNASSVTPEEDPGYMERRLTEMRSKKH